MPKIDVVDEAIIEADPSVVFELMMDELSGAKKWWMPHWEAEPRGNVPLRQIGGMIDITVHRIGTSRWAARTVEIVNDRLIKLENFEGDFIGSEEFTFEPLDGKTKVKSRWIVEPNRMLLSLFYPLIPRIHSNVMRKGYAALNDYLNEKQPVKN